LKNLDVSSILTSLVGAIVVVPAAGVAVAEGAIVVALVLFWIWL
jgi:NADH:ubiquinone oxidoreductase subunit K